MAPTDDDNVLVPPDEEKPQEPAEEEEEAAAPMEVEEPLPAPGEAPEAPEEVVVAAAVEESAAADVKQEANNAPEISVEEAVAGEAAKASEAIDGETAAAVKEEGGEAKEEETKEEEEVEQASEHVLYPGGGNFNKLRKKQKFLEQLLKDNVEGYIGSNSKRDFVKEKILDKIPGGLKVFSKEKGEVYVPDQHEAFDRVSQKIRDIKKYRLKAANNTATPRRVAHKRATKTSTGAPKTPTARRRYYKDPAEEGVKDKLILEMRAEITRLRANVMTAHEKIRTLEQLHAHDEERILHLQEELGIKKGPEAVARAQAKAAASATAAAVAAAAAAEAEAAETEAAAIAEAAAAAAAADENDNKHEAEDDPEGEPSPKKQRVEEVDAENTIAV